MGKERRCGERKSRFVLIRASKNIRSKIEGKRRGIEAYLACLQNVAKASSLTKNQRCLNS